MVGNKFNLERVSIFLVSPVLFILSTNYIFILKAPSCN